MGSIQKMLMYGQRFLQLIRQVQRQMVEDRCMDNAAALTFSSLLALVPMITVAYAVLAMIPDLQATGAQLQLWIFKHFVPSSGVEVQNYLQSFAQQAKKLTSLGLLMLFVTALTMMRRIEHTLNFIWRVTEPRKGVDGFLRYWAVLTLGPLLVGAGLGLTSYITSLRFFSSALEVLSVVRYSFVLLPFFLSWVAFSLIYRVVPNCEIKMKSCVIGGFVAALIFECGKRGFALFVVHFSSYQLIYGAFAALPVFLLWLHFSWLIFLLGGVLTRVLSVKDEGNHYDNH